MHLDKLQAEVGHWARQNFGDQPPAYALVGASEEVGELAEAYLRLYQTSSHSPGIDDQIMLALELQAMAGQMAHSILKRTQGIRQDEPEVGPEAEAAAAERIQMLLDDLADIRGTEYTGREIVPGAVPEPDEELVDSVADTVIYLADFSERAGLDMDESVSSTWNGIVSERQWDSDVGGSDV